MHITALLAAANLLARARHHWSGTLILCFQPAEEVGGGAQAMVDDGLYLKVPVPDVVLGGHVMPFRSGYIGTRRGLMASAADSFQLTIHGRGGHASQPHRSRDPILTAAHTITRLQTIVARETDPADPAVVTVSAIHAGDAENVIPTQANLKLNVRTFNPDTRARILTSVKRIVDAEALAGEAPKAPDLKPTSSFPFLVNDAGVTAKLETSFAAHFRSNGQTYDPNTIKLGGSEDFGVLATAVNRPASYWCYGGIDPVTWDNAEEEGNLESLPFNHSPYFAPIIQPTLMVATDAYAVAALTWLTT
jgi:amidohydrolase